MGTRENKFQSSEIVQTQVKFCHQFPAFHRYFQVLYMNIKICFRHFVFGRNDFLRKYIKNSATEVCNAV